MAGVTIQRSSRIATVDTAVRAEPGRFADLRPRVQSWPEPAARRGPNASVPLDLAHARRLHRSRHPIDDREARTSAPGRGRAEADRGGRRFRVVPVVRRPDVAGRVDRTSVSIWMLPPWNTWMTSPVLVPAGWPLVSAPAINTTPATRGERLATQTSSLPSMFKPHGMSILPPPVKPFGAGCVPSGRIKLITPVGFG